MRKNGWPAMAIPRTGDPIDWIEQIPFGETRNYVQRVSGEYRGLPGAAGGQGCAAQILHDLYAPRCRLPCAGFGMQSESSEYLEREIAAASDWP
jgi:hypothetical protein